MKISFNPDLFNDIYWHLKEDLKNPLIRYIFLYGGSSASKTYTYVQSDITALLEFENENVMVLRKYGVDIKDSIYSDYVKIISDWGLQEYFKCQINYIQCTLTGSYIRFRGLDDSEKIKGLANFKRVVLEEISQSYTGVSSIEMTNGGSGYLTAPIVTITGDGTGATAESVIINGRVAGITITNRGSGYTRALVTISGGSGYGATAVAVLDAKFGTIRTIYYDEFVQRQTVKENVGTINYDTGIITINDILILSVNSNNTIFPSVSS